MISRRSWFEPARWWAQSALSAGAVLGTTLTATTAAGGREQNHLLVPLALTVLAAVLGPAMTRSHHRRWSELEDACLDEHDALVAAERAVRDGVAPTSEAQRLVAVRITELRWRELNGWWSPALLSVITAALVVAAAAHSPRWWPALAVAVAVLVVTTVQVRRLARRRAELELTPVAG